MEQNVSFFMAVLGGLISFLSPCVLPLVPSYLSYISGISFEDLSIQSAAIRKKVFLHTLVFILGFSIVFIILGASITLLGRLFSQHILLIRKIGGVILVLFGLQIMGIFHIPFLEREHKVRVMAEPMGYLSSFLIGSVFAFGWTPCVGPILGGILLYAGTAGKLTQGVLLLGGYSLGFGIPLILMGLLFGQFLIYFSKLKKHMRVVTVISGLFLIFMGILLFIGRFEVLIK